MSQKPVLVISHANCSDGATAAAIVELAMQEQGRTVEHLPEGYNYKTLPDVKNREVYIVDFCYPREAMELLQGECSRLVLLDHHASAEKAMQGFKCRCGEIHFDMEESGASLVWRYFFKEKPMPGLVKHVKDFDLWQWKLDKTESVMNYLDVMGKDNIGLFKEIIEQGDAALEGIYAKGAHFSELKRSLVREIVSEAIEMELLGQKTLKVSAPASLASFVGNELAKRTGTFGVVYRQCADGSLKLSLRSLDGFSLLDMATALGGGGHPSSSSAILKNPEQIAAFHRGILSV